jgi:hypothetical protein
MIKLDGTKNKSRLGANAILAVSIAAAQVSNFSCENFSTGIEFLRKNSAIFSIGIFWKFAGILNFSG